MAEKVRNAEKISGKSHTEQNDQQNNELIKAIQ